MGFEHSLCTFSSIHKHGIIQLPSAFPPPCPKFIQSPKRIGAQMQNKFWITGPSKQPTNQVSKQQKSNSQTHQNLPEVSQNLYAIFPNAKEMLRDWPHIRLTQTCFLPPYGGWYPRPKTSRQYKTCIPYTVFEKCWWGCSLVFCSHV